MVKRYDMVTEYNKFACEDQVVPVEDNQGEYVRFEDYAVLAAQVEALRDTCSYWINHARPSGDCSKSEYNTWFALGYHSRAMTKSAQQHLAEIKAQAGRDGFIAGSEQTAQFITGEIGYVLPLLEARASQYADSIRRGE